MIPMNYVGTLNTNRGFSLRELAEAGFKVNPDLTWHIATHPKSGTSHLADPGSRCAKKLGALPLPQTMGVEEISRLKKPCWVCLNTDPEHPKLDMAAVVLIRKLYYLIGQYQTALDMASTEGIVLPEDSLLLDYQLRIVRQEVTSSNTKTALLETATALVDQVETFQEEIYGWGKVIYSRETLRKMPNPFFTLTRSAKATLGFLGREPLNGQTTVQVSNLEMVEAVMRLGAEAFMKEGSSSRSLSGHWENRTRALINWEMKESFPDQQGAYIATTALREMRDILQEIVENNPNEDLDFVLEAGLKTWKSAKVIDKILQRVVTEDLCPKRWEQIPADSLSKLQGATVKEAVASLWRENVLKDLSKMFKKGAEAISNVAHNGPWEPVMVEYSTWSDSELLGALTHTRPHLVMNASSSLVQVPNVLLPLVRGAKAGGGKALEVKVPWINQTDFERIAELAEAMGERKDDWVDVNFQDAVDAWLLINDRTL